jgi:hypothetical protein
MKDCGLRECHTCACNCVAIAFMPKKSRVLMLALLMQYSFKEAKSSQTLLIDTSET